MSNIKKIIGVVLALVMALSVATIAFAASGDAYSVTVTAEKTELAPGEQTNVTVSVTTNYNVSAMSIPVFFDKAKVTVSAGATGLGDGAEIITDTNPDADVSAIYEGSARSKDKYGLIALAYIAPYYATITTYNNEAVMTFTVTANADATGTTVLECVEAAVKTSANPSGTLYVAKNSSGSAEVDSLGEVIDDATITSATINIASASQPADLELKELGVTNNIKIDKSKTFGGAYDGAVYGFPQLANNTFMNTAYLTNNLQATNGGTISFSRTIGSSGYGTGTLITVKNADASESKHYIVVIFGDIDGNGLINTADVTAIKTATTKATVAPENSIKRMAANTAGTNAMTLRLINTADVTAVKYFTTKKQFSATSTVTTLANAHNAANTYYQ